MIRVLVVEDSPTARQLLVGLMENDPDIRVVGEAVNGRQAVDMAIELEPDLITMDVVMPDMDGLEATRQIMLKRPTPIVIITAHADDSELDIAFDAMAAGAVDVMSKPSGFGKRTESTWGKGLVNKIRNLSRARPKRLE